MGRDGDLLEKGCPKMFDGPAGSVVVGIAGEDHLAGNLPDERRHGLAGLQGVSMPSVSFGDFKSDVAGVKADVVSVPDPKVQMADVGPPNGDPEMVVGDEAVLPIAGYDLGQPQGHRPLHQTRWGRGKSGRGSRHVVVDQLASTSHHSV